MGPSGYMFSQGYSLYFFSHFGLFTVVWGLGFWIGVLGLGFQLMGFGAHGVKPHGFCVVGALIEKQQWEKFCVPVIPD